MKTISYDDYLRLLGLMALATDHRKAMEAIERSACGITGEVAGSGGHTGDAVWGERDVTSLLEVLGIAVEPQQGIEVYWREECPFRYCDNPEECKAHGACWHAPTKGTTE